MDNIVSQNRVICCHYGWICKHTEKKTMFRIGECSFIWIIPRTRPESVESVIDLLIMPLVEAHHIERVHEVAGNVGGNVLQVIAYERMVVKTGDAGD